MIGRGFGVFLIVHPSLSSQLLLELPMIFHLYFLLFLCDHHRELFIFSLINKIAYFPSFFFLSFAFLYVIWQSIELLGSLCFLYKICIFFCMKKYE